MFGRTLLRLFVLSAMMSLLISSNTLAGGINIRTSSIEINGGQNRPVRPSEIVSMSFLADMFAFGSDESEYILFSIISEQKYTDSIDRSDIAMQNLFVLNMGKVDKQPGAAVSPRHAVELIAPRQPGRYKIIYNRLPYFSLRPLLSGGRVGDTFTPRVGTRDAQLLSEHLWKYKQMWTDTVPLVVRSEAPISAGEPPKLYLTVNGSTPGLKPIKTGPVDTPLVFRWSVNPDFKFPEKLLYRHQMTIDGDEWSGWSSAKETSLFFLPKGIHEFRVQAKYDGQEGSVFSQVARYSFILGDPFIARPTKDTLSKPATLGNIVRLPTPDIGTVYAGSRALLFGIYAYEDSATFSQLPKERIERDVSAVSEALSGQGFNVTSIVRPSVTTQDVRDAIDAFIKSSRNNERLFIYFSSHGFPDPNAPADGYIATTDCRAKSARSKCLSLDSLRQQFSESIERGTRQIVIAVDSCFSGLGVVVKSIPNSNLNELANRQGIYMLTAGMEHQTAGIDEALKMSTFTHYLVQGLNGRADLFDNGIISLTELFLYVQYQVADRTKAAQIPMMGRIFGSGEMLFAVPKRAQAAQ